LVGRTHRGRRGHGDLRGAGRPPPLMREYRRDVAPTCFDDDP
jgi:hypothetical protein